MITKGSYFSSIVFTSILLLATLSTSAQEVESEKRWFAELNGGTRLFGATSDSATLAPGLNINAGLGYNFSNLWGIKGSLDVNTFSFTPDEFEGFETNGYSYGLSLEGIFNLAGLGQSGKVKKFDMNLHSGVGWTTYDNNAVNNFYSEDDPLIKGNDDMGHIVIGLTYSYRFSESIAFNLDATSFVLFSQDYTFDSYNLQPINERDVLGRLSAGLTFRF